MYAPAGTKNDATHTSSSTAARTVNAVGNFSLRVSGASGDTDGSGVELAAPGHAAQSFAPDSQPGVYAPWSRRGYAEDSSR